MATDRGNSHIIATTFANAAAHVAAAAGRAAAFAFASIFVLIWAVSGPIFRFSDTWQLAITTGTAIITFLMVFLIKNSQNRDSASIQTKLNELIRTSRAQNAFNSTPHYYYLNAHKSIDIATNIDIFSDLSREILSEGRTLLNYDRLYTLFQAVMQLPQSPVAVEVGAYKGGSSKFIAALLRSQKGGGKLYSCDTFTGHAVVDDRYDGKHFVKNYFGKIILANEVVYQSPSFSGAGGR